MKKEYLNKRFFSTVLAVVVSVFAIVTTVTAASTISTSITTGGDLSVTGNSTLTGTLGVTGDTTVVNLTTTGTVANSGTVTVGSSGSAITQLNFGTCYIDPYSATITGTTTVAVDCQGTLNVDAAMASGSAGGSLTGITSSSLPIVQLSTTTAFIANTRGLAIVGASASTTAGHIELRIANNSGATYTWSTVAGTASGTAVYMAPR